MDELVNQNDDVFTPENIDTQEGFNQGFNYATPDEQDEIVATASNAHKPSIIVTPGQGIAYENMDAAPDRFQAFYESTLQGKHKLDKDGYAGCVRAFCNEVYYNPEYNHLSKEGKAKRVKEMAFAYGIEDYLFQDSENPSQAYSDFVDGIIAQSFKSSPDSLAKIVESAVKQNSANDRLSRLMRSNSDYNSMQLQRIVDANTIENEDGTPTVDEQQIKMDEEELAARDNAFKAELMLRVQDDLSAWLQDNINASDAEIYAMSRDFAVKNFGDVARTVDSGDDYVVAFAQKRKVDTEDRARRFHQQYLDAKSDMQPLKKAGEDMRVVSDTRQAKQNAIENFKRQEANKTAREEFKNENNLGAAKPRKQYVAETTSYPFYIGVSKQYADEPPCIIVPEEEYSIMCRDMNIGEGDGLMMDIGTKQNPERVPLRPGKVTIPRMNIPLANRKYVNGKKKGLRADQYKAAEQGVRYTVRFVKTSKKK